jgi:hypothetical protein
MEAEASAARDAMAAIAANAASCAHCGKQLLAPKRCSICKNISYCGAECQKAGWKRHKKTCEPPLPLRQVRERFEKAHATGDWRGVLKLEGRMEELMGADDYNNNTILAAFARAHDLGYESTANSEHALSFIRVQERRVELLGNMERFRDQGDALCSLGDHLHILGKRQESEAFFQRARDLGAQHGFFSLRDAQRVQRVPQGCFWAVPVVHGPFPKVPDQKIKSARLPLATLSGSGSEKNSCVFSRK